LIIGIFSEGRYDVDETFQMLGLPDRDIEEGEDLQNEGCSCSIPQLFCYLLD
jgi:hypothetical protein